MMGNSMIGQSMMGGSMMIPDQKSSSGCRICGIITVVALVLLVVVGLLYATDTIQITFMDGLLGYDEGSSSQSGKSTPAHPKQGKIGPNGPKKPAPKKPKPVPKDSWDTDEK